MGHPVFTHVVAMIQRSAFCAFLCLAATTVVCPAQQGDRKGHEMIDPIPAAKIPPSPYLSLRDALNSFKIASGYVIEPVAYGTDVDLAVAISFDANGRAWTCEMRSYMPDISGNGEKTPNGRIRVLEDTDGDGKTDQVTTFLDGLVLPRAVSVTSDGCLYTSGNALYFIKRKGLVPVGEPIVVDPDYAKAGNPEHGANGLIYGHDNWYYSAKYAKRYRRFNGKWVTEATDHRGQWGITKDNAGRLYYNNNSTLLQGDRFRPNFFRGNPGNPPAAKMTHRLGSNRVHPIHMTPGVNRGYMKGTLDKNGKLVNATASCGVVIYRGDNFPASAQGMAFSCEPSADLVKAIQLTRDAWNKPSGSHPLGTNEFLASTDEWFLPCNLYTGPDGTLWMVDMYFGMLQHKTYMTSYLRKQYISRGLDKTPPSTGRIYRIRYADTPASPVPRMEGLAAGRLVEFLNHPNGLHRDTAQRLIVESGDTSVLKPLVELASDDTKPLGQIHALWTLDGLNLESYQALEAALKSSDPEVVATALDIVSIRRISEPSTVDVIDGIKPEARILHSLVRALAVADQPEKALQLVLKNPNADLLREAFISGLGENAAHFHNQHGKVADASLEKMIVAASQARSVKTSSPGKHLHGKELASFIRGQEVFTTKAACIGCHGDDGNGLTSLGPPLVKSEWVTGNATRLSKVLLHGMTGPVRVDGTVYTPALAMPGLGANAAISDQDIADVMTFVRNSWGNKAKAVDAKLVKQVRTDTKDRSEPYKATEL
ncbi:MAG: c-type cytochrome [Akkermansiaceae bacterium]|nr:c-type cytochrome [Akkermansiaceae bacterium]